MIRTKPLKPGKPLKRSGKRMRQGRSTGAPTKAQAERFDAIKEIGCIACRLRGQWRAAEIHHLTVGGRHGQKRLGHDETVGLCPWHHRGDFESYTPEWFRAHYGPSYAREPRAFRERFPDAVLLEATNKALREWQAGTMGAGA